MKEMFLRTKLDKYLDKNVSGRVTRSHTVPKLYVPSFKTNQARKSHIYKGSVTWNNLEYTEKKIMCKDMFSKLMKKNLKKKENCIMNHECNVNLTFPKANLKSVK